MDSQLLTGVVLIAAGLALGLLAYAIVLGRRERAEPEGSAAEAEPMESRSTPSEPAQPAPEPTPPVPAPSRPAAVPPPSVPPVPAPAAPMRPATSGARTTVAIASLERNDATGELMIRVGDREYRNVKELRASPDWVRVSYAAGDLQRWMAEVAEADRPRPAPSAAAAPAARSMIEQINGILARKIAETGVGRQGVRLVDSAGVVQVLVGMERFEMGNVPDEQIQRLIREAVSEWEAHA